MADAPPSEDMRHKSRKISDSPREMGAHNAAKGPAGAPPINTNGEKMETVGGVSHTIGVRKYPIHLQLRSLLRENVPIM